jgi:tRNA-dihydrouridine synthase
VNALGALVDGHLRAIGREFGPVAAPPRMRKHLLWYARFFEGAERLRAEVFATDDPDAVVVAAARFFTADPRRLDPAGAAFRERDALFRRRVLYWTRQ